MLKIAAADQNWLQQMVLGERRRLASLHKSALIETQTAMDDDKDSPVHKTVVDDKTIVIASNKKADQSPNEPGSYAVESHEGDKAYENDLDPKVGSRKKSDVVPTALDPNDKGGYAAESHASEMDALAAQIKRMTSSPFDPDPLKD